MSAVTQIKGSELAEILKMNEFVLVNFSAPWCGPCKSMAPTLEQVATENISTMLVVKLDIDEDFELASEYQVRAVPTLLFFRAGQVVNRAIGGQSKGQLIKLITEYKG